MSRKMPVIRQMENADCGAACLAMVLAYFGRRADLGELRDLTGADRDGVSALAIVRAARASALRARGVRAGLDDLRHVPRGTILHWEFNHFVVFDRATRTGIRVIDPAHGRRIVPQDDLKRAYTGVAVLLEPGEDFHAERTRAKGTWRYLRPMLGQTRNMVRVITTSLVLRLAALGLPLLTVLVVDEIVPRDDHRLLLVFSIAVAAVIGYNFLSSFLRANVLLELQTRLDMGLTMGFLDHLFKLPYNFFLRRSSGDLMMRLQSNTAVRDILATGTMSAVLDGAFASLYLVLLFVISPVLALVVLVLALCQIAAMLLSWRRGQRLMSGSLQAQADTQSYAYEMLAGIETLKASGAEHRAADRWANLFTEQVNIDLSRGRLGAAVSSVMGTLQVASPLVILMVGTFQVLGGHLSLGTMLSASALGAGFLNPLASLVASGLQLQQLTSYMQRINDVLDTPREQEGKRLRPAPPLTGQIRAENVWFGYGTLGPAVVSDVSLEIQPGQHVGIVGRSGSGKSTLAHLLLGLYEPTSGRIMFDGRDLAGIEAATVRRQVGIVTQHPYLFGTSIRDNIALTNPELPLDAVMNAARIACVHDDIAAMPMGYETLLHDGGSSISGGQRQRIALARALVHRPSIVLLDEATSELDTVTEQRIYRNLDEISSTTIVIAHRLSTIRNADLILVMDQGKIIETGTHEQLLARQGAYAALVSAQSPDDEAPTQPIPLWARTPTA